MSINRYAINRTTINAAPVTVAPSYPRVIMPTIADRVARSMVLGIMATHVVVGTHMLKGATQRTKVAPVVIRTTRITPPPTKTQTLPYRLQGAPKRAPRPFPDVVLTRKPLPITRSVALPHMLKGAVVRKPTPFPDAILTRTPPPVTRAVVGKRSFRPPPASPRPDPAVAFFKAPLARIKSFVARSLAPQLEEHPPFPQPIARMVRTPLPRIKSTTPTSFDIRPVGNGAPSTAMFESPAPRTTSFVGRRLSPIGPAKPRPRPFTALIRSLRPITRSIVGIANPRAAASRARPVIATVRITPPKIASLEGPRGNWYRASHERWVRPTTIQVRTPLPHTQSWTGIPVGGVTRDRWARPIAILVRSPLPVIRSVVGTPNVAIKRIRAYLVVDTSGPQFMISDTSTSEFLMSDT